jgi:hypothetical protein
MLRRTFSIGSRGAQTPLLRKTWARHNSNTSAPKQKRRYGAKFLLLASAYIGTGLIVVNGLNTIESQYTLPHNNFFVQKLRSIKQWYEAQYRVTQCAYILTTLGTDILYHNKRTEGMPREEAKQIMHKVHEREAKRLLNALINLGGVFVKLGQELGMMIGIVPEEYTTAMKVLQDHV